MKASVHHFFANVFVRTSISSIGQNHGSRNGQTYCYCRRDDSRHKKAKIEENKHNNTSQKGRKQDQIITQTKYFSVNILLE